MHVHLQQFFTHEAQAKISCLLRQAGLVTTRFWYYRQKYSASTSWHHIFAWSAFPQRNWNRLKLPVPWVVPQYMSWRGGVWTFTNILFCDIYHADGPVSLFSSGVVVKGTQYSKTLRLFETKAVREHERWTLMCHPSGWNGWVLQYTDRWHLLGRITSADQRNLMQFNNFWFNCLYK